MAEHQLYSSNLHPEFADCCLKGKIERPKLDPIPQPLKHLLDGQGSEAKQLHQNIRQNNSAFAFTSLWADFDQSVL
jgi:hypothetical protein